MMSLLIYIENEQHFRYEKDIGIMNYYFVDFENLTDLHAIRRQVSVQEDIT